MCPMSNRDIEATHEYHTATKHSYWSVRLGSHFLDLEHKPLPFKVYPTLPAIPLPRHIAPPAAEALNTISAFQSIGTSMLDLAGLAQVLFFYAGLWAHQTS